jgi:hypothetical protein
LGQNRHDPPYGAKARLSILRQLLRQLVDLNDEYADQGLAIFALAVDPFEALRSYRKYFPTSEKFVPISLSMPMGFLP